MEALSGRWLAIAGVGGAIIAGVVAGFLATRLHALFSGRTTRLALDLRTVLIFGASALGGVLCYVAVQAVLPPPPISGAVRITVPPSSPGGPAAVVRLEYSGVQPAHSVWLLNHTSQGYYIYGECDGLSPVKGPDQPGAAQWSDTLGMVRPIERQAFELVAVVATQEGNAWLSTSKLGACAAGSVVRLPGPRPSAQVSTWPGVTIKATARSQ
jgi:hypothetical protein